MVMRFVFLAYFHLSILGSVSHKRLFIYLRHVSAVLDTYLTLPEAMRDTITLIKPLPTNSRLLFLFDKK